MQTHYGCTKHCINCTIGRIIIGTKLGNHSYYDAPVCTEVLLDIVTKIAWMLPPWCDMMYPWTVGSVFGGSNTLYIQPLCNIPGNTKCSVQTKTRTIPSHVVVVALTLDVVSEIVIKLSSNTTIGYFHVHYFTLYTSLTFSLFLATPYNVHCFWINKTFIYLSDRY